LTKQFPKVFIIVLNWNKLQNILECLKSVFLQDYPNYEVVVVDNASTDGSCDVIEREYPTVCLIKNSTNLGYAGGNNVGIRYAMSKNPDYIWLLNNDLTVERKCLREIIGAAEKSDSIGLVSPIVYHYDRPNQSQFAGSYMNWEDLSLVYLDWDSEVGEKYEIPSDLCLWGTALLIKRKLIEKIGYLKDEYFAYWEDIEYSLRSIKAGFENVVCKSGKVFHRNEFEEGNGFKKEKYFYYFMQRNRIILANEYFEKVIPRLKFKIRYFAELSDYVRRYGNGNIDAVMDGAWHGIKGITGPMRSEDKMPSYIKKLLVLMSRLHPVFFADLITFRFEKISRKIGV